MIILFPLSKGLCPVDFVAAAYLASCYHIVPTGVPISEAKLGCQEIHSKSRLVSIETNTEHDFLKHYLEQLNLQGGKLLIVLLALRCATAQQSCCRHAGVRPSVVRPSVREVRFLRARQAD